MTQKRRIGELLLEQGVISTHQLEAALIIQKQTRARLGITLISQGFVTEDALVAALSVALGVPRVDLKAHSPDWAAVHLLRPRFCELNEVFPFALEKDPSGAKKALLVAMADPLNAGAVQQIEFTTGLPVSPRIATLSDVRGAILRYHHKVDPNLQPGLAVPSPAALRPLAPAAPQPPDEPAVVVGTALPVDPFAEHFDLQQLIDRRAAAAAKKSATVAKDLEYLFGEKVERTDLERLEQKFWALMRIMARKGLITKDEFRSELDEGEP